MLNLTIDGMTDQINIENFKLFRNLFDLLTEEMEKEGRTITTVTINGNLLITEKWIRKVLTIISDYSYKVRS